MSSLARSLENLNDADYADVCAFNYYISNGLTRDAYKTLRRAFPKHLGNLQSLFKVQKKIAALSGLKPKYADCCINSCCCYTGPWKDHNRCPFPECQEPRFDKFGKPRKQFQYLPIIPRLKAFFLDQEMAGKMQYRHKLTKKLPRDKVTDVFDGSLYNELRQKHVKVNGKDLPHEYFSDARDIALGLSLDGVAPFKNQKQTAWPVILFNFNLPPEIRTHLEHILCFGVIPGPKSVKDVDSFLWPLYDKLVDLAKGVKTLDLQSREFFKLRAYLLLAFGDIPAISKLMSMKGHNGCSPCRSCEIKGMTKPGEGVHYVPLRRTDNSSYDPRDLPYRSHQEFIKQASKVLDAPSDAASNALAKEYGIKGLPFMSLLGSIDLPRSFPYDFMHLIFENLIPNLIRHYTGDFKGLDDGVEDYRLPKSVWEAICEAGAKSGDTIPSCFGARIPNLESERSHMTAETWSFWVMYLGPALLKGKFSKPKYYKHFMKLVGLIHLCVSFKIKRSDIETIRSGFIEWVEVYERYAH